MKNEWLDVVEYRETIAEFVRQRIPAATGRLVYGSECAIHGVVSVMVWFDQGDYKPNEELLKWEHSDGLAWDAACKQAGLVKFEFVVPKTDWDAVNILAGRKPKGANNE